jgi:hypothetical protein
LVNIAIPLYASSVTKSLKIDFVAIRHSSTEGELKVDFGVMQESEFVLLERIDSVPLEG